MRSTRKAFYFVGELTNQRRRSYHNALAFIFDLRA